MTREEEIQDENYHIAQLSKAYRNLKDHIKAQKEEIASLREIVCAVNDKVKNGDNADFYAWSPFDENHLETLAVDCPVLIPAGWLRQMLSAQEKENQRLRDANNTMAAYLQSLANPDAWNGRTYIRGFREPWVYADDALRYACIEEREPRRSQQGDTK